MKITIEPDGLDPVVYTDLTDLYIAIRQNKAVAIDGGISVVPVISSTSWGNHTRDIVKELRQSLDELKEYLRKVQDGGNSS